MGKLKKSILFLACLLFSSTVFAKQITIQIIQHNIATDKVAESSLVIEDGLLDGFFDNGFIVSNTPASVSVSEKQDLSLYNTGLGDAYEGGADFFVQIKLFYDGSAQNKSGTPKKSGKKKETIRESGLERVDWTVASAVTGKKIKESTMSFSDAEANGDDLGLLSANLIFEIKRAIKAVKA